MDQDPSDLKIRTKYVLSFWIKKIVQFTYPLTERRPVAIVQKPFVAYGETDVCSLKCDE